VLPRLSEEVSMRFGRIGVLAVALCVVCGLAEAGLPKPVSLIQKVSNSESRGATISRMTKYDKPTWGTRWRQTLAPVPAVVTPFVRGY
jgi:hypothetical protein